MKFIPKAAMLLTFVFAILTAAFSQEASTPVSSPVATPSPSSADSSDKEFFHKGERTVYGFLALGGFHGVYGSTTIPPIGAGYDYALNENVSAGVLVGITRSDYAYFDLSYTYFILGGKVAYHPTDLNLDLPLDPYVALTLGYNVVTVSGGGSSASGSYLLWGGAFGARYWFKENLAVQAELGYGIGYFNIGIVYKL